MYANAVCRSISRRSRKAIVTSGLKCAPDTGPIAPINTISMAPVAVELQNSASAELPPDSCSPMMPEPTIAASSSGAEPFSSQAPRKTL
jgi:hypothetical protein